MTTEGRSDSYIASERGAAPATRLRAIRAEAGFTLIEVVLAGVMLAILSVPISGLISTAAAIARLDRERTSADQLAQTQIEDIRALPYTDVGIQNGNPQGNLSASQQVTLLQGDAVTIATSVTWVADDLPGAAYPTNADYKKVVLTITRNSDGKQLAQKTTYVSAASSPPGFGSKWIQIQRTVVDGVANLALPGANVNLTGGPDTSPATNRNDTTDAAGNVLFPALDTTTTGTPVYALATTLSGYSVYPDDLPPGSAEQISSLVYNDTSGIVRMYKPVSLTVNLQNSSGQAYTGGATISLDSSRCGQQTVTVPSGSSSTTITSCYYANGKSVSLVPNLLAQTPAFNSYFVTAWTSGGLYGVSPAVTVPSNYPSILTQSVTVKLGSTSYSQKTLKVTVTNGGSNDSNARVEVTGGPSGIASSGGVCPNNTGSPGVYLYGDTGSSGYVNITVPVTSSSSTFTVCANDTGVQKGTSTVSISSSTSNPSVTVAIS
jgi:Tfp pilus assembly protein PilV